MTELQMEMQEYFMEEEAAFVKPEEVEEITSWLDSEKIAYTVKEADPRGLAQIILTDGVLE